MPIKKHTSWTKQVFPILSARQIARQFTPTHLDGKAMDLSRYTHYFNKRLDELQRQYSKATPKALSSEIWRKLEGTNSFSAQTEVSARKALEQSTKSGFTALDAAIDEFNSGKVRCPVILKYGTGKHTLISGDMHLMVARIAKLTPRVIIIETDW